MNTATAHRIVLMSAMLTFGVGWFKSAKDGKPVPSGKFLIGGSVAFLVISAISDVEPQLGGALALAIATTVFLAQSDPLLSHVNVPPQSASGQKKTEKKKPVKPVHVAPHN